MFNIDNIIKTIYSGGSKLNLISNIIPVLAPNIGNKSENITITEISNIWAMLDNAMISLSNIEVIHNQASNEKLKKLLKDIRDNSTTKMIDEFTGILNIAKVQSPAGFKKREMVKENIQKNDSMLTDAEIALTAAVALEGALTCVNNSMVQSSNTKIALMYLKYYNDIAQYLAKLMDMCKEGSWSNTPPTLKNIKQ